jgi:hypothetical protein
VKLTQENLDKLTFIPEKNCWAGRRYPSNRCRNTYTKETCRNCGEEFLAISSSKKMYCSKKCYSDTKRKVHAAIRLVTEVKRCNKCGKVLPIDQFYSINKNIRSNEYSSLCKQCCLLKGLAWRSKDPIRTRCLYTLNRIKRKDKDCDIDIEWLHEKFSNGICEVTGIPFDFGYGRKRHPYSPSIDRIDPTKGYTKENCQIVIWIYNMAKGEWSEEILNDFVTYYAEILNGRINKKAAA